MADAVIEAKEGEEGLALRRQMEEQMHNETTESAAEETQQTETVETVEPEAAEAKAE